MKPHHSRRDALKLGTSAAVGAMFAPRLAFGAEQEAARFARGAVIGEATAAKTGLGALADGGNAADAAVTAALVASVFAPHQCGPGGYGGCMVYAHGKSGAVTALDFNTVAPAALRADIFKPDGDGKVRGRINEFGWLATGVPGTLAGLEAAWRRFGRLPFERVFSPAAELAGRGFVVNAGFAGAARAMAVQLRKDAGSAKLLLPAGEPVKAGDTFRNEELAEVLRACIVRRSVRDFYRGDIALRIAEAFAKHGGLVTAKDLAGFEAREVKPLEVSWRGATVRTAPVGAGGLTPLQALAVLRELGWDTRPVSSERAWLRIETLRAAWRDRLQLLGDVRGMDALATKLLSAGGAQLTAARVLEAVRSGKPIAASGSSREHGGTIHLSAVDEDGNMAALTLTHGNSFGACVTVPGLGLTLGHGMSRFDPQPGHPNAPGPRKRPLHNMCPTVVSRGGRPVLALGGAGGRRIPNSLLDVLLSAIVDGASVDEAVAAPRVNTEGGLDIGFEAKWPPEEQAFFKSAGYNVSTSRIARISAVSFDPRTGGCRAAAR